MSSLLGLSMFYRKSFCKFQAGSFFLLTRGRHLGRDDARFPPTTASRSGETSTVAAIPHIQLPHNYSETLSRKRYQQNLYKLQQEQPQDDGPSRLLISCRDRRRNHYSNQVYPKWARDKLASCSWLKKTVTVGDHFTLLSHGARPGAVKGKRLHVGEESKGEFEALGLTTGMAKVLQSIGIHVPAIIQSLTIPSILVGQNVVCSGETGGGKTLAFLAPLIDRILLYNAQYASAVAKLKESTQMDGCLAPAAIIMAPSNELCAQLENVAVQLCTPFELKAKFLTGGNIQKTNDNVDIVICSPNTLLTALENGKIKGSGLRHLVLDEADTQLDSSFSDTVLDLLGHLEIQTTQPIDNVSLGVQIILASATFPRNVDQVFGNYLPIESFRVIKSPFLHRLLPNVTQKFIRTTEEDRQGQIVTHLKRNLARKIVTLVFVNRNSTAAMLDQLLTDNNVPHAALWGELSPSQRKRAFESFQNGESNILVSTDLGSRGLDTIRAQQVINFDFPSFLSDYIHRLGRVGRLRSASAGSVVNYVTFKWEIALVQEIETSARRTESLPNVDANIHQALRDNHQARTYKQQERRAKTKSINNETALNVYENMSRD